MTMLVPVPLLVFGLVSLAADVSSCSGSSSHTMSEDVNAVNRFIAAACCADADERNRPVVVRLAEIIDFPIARKYPLPSIYSAGELGVAQRCS